MPVGNSRKRAPWAANFLLSWEGAQMVDLLYIVKPQSRDTKQDLQASDDQSELYSTNKHNHAPVIMRSPSALARTSTSINLSAFAWVNDDLR